MKAVNLIPADDAPGGRTGGSPTDGLGAYVLLAVLAGLVVMTAAWAMTKRQLTDERAALARVAVEAKAAKAKTTALQPYVDFAALRTARVDTVGVLLDARADWSRNLRDLGRVIPRHVSVVSLVGTASAEAKVEGGGGGQSVRGTSVGPAIDLVGCARTQAQVADLILALRAIDGVEAVRLASSDESDAAAAGDTECRATDQMPQFSLTIAYDPLPGAPAVVAPVAVAPVAEAAGQTGGQE